LSLKQVHCLAGLRDS